MSLGFCPGVSKICSLLIFGEAYSKGFAKIWGGVLGCRPKRPVKKHMGLGQLFIVPCYSYRVRAVQCANENRLGVGTVINAKPLSEPLAEPPPQVVRNGMPAPRHYISPLLRHCIVAAEGPHGVWLGRVGWSSASHTPGVALKARRGGSHRSFKPWSGLSTKKTLPSTCQRLGVLQMHIGGFYGYFYSCSTSMTMSALRQCPTG